MKSLRVPTNASSVALHALKISAFDKQLPYVDGCNIRYVDVQHIFSDMHPTFFLP